MKTKKTDVDEIILDENDLARMVSREAEYQRNQEAAKSLENMFTPRGGAGQMSGGADGHGNRGKSTPATPRDHDEESDAEMQVFARWLCDGSMPDGVLGERLAVPDGFKDASSGIRAPSRLCNSLLGKATMVTYQPPGSSLVRSEDFIPQVIRLPADALTLFDRVSRSSSIIGQSTWPILRQADGNRLGGVSCAWIGEAGEKPEQDVQIDQSTISTSELAARTEVSSTMLRRSAIDVEAFVRSLFRSALIGEIDRTILVGTGTAQPQGIVGSTGVRTVARSDAGTVGYSDLVDMVYSVNSADRGGCIWVIADSVLQSLAKVSDADGYPLYGEGGIGKGVLQQLLGYPVIPTTHTGLMGTSGDVLFGNPRWYQLLLETDVVFLRNPFEKMKNNIVILYAYILAGGRLLAPQAWCELVGTSGS